LTEWLSALYQTNVTPESGECVGGEDHFGRSEFSTYQAITLQQRVSAYGSFALLHHHFIGNAGELWKQNGC
jgi:hypothetical protein